MAKKTAPQEPASTDVIKWGEQTIHVVDLPQAAIHYLLQYGANKSRQDAVAGMKKELTAEGKTEDEIAQAMEVEFADRLARIMDGTISTRVVGPRKLGIEKVMADIARERITASCAARKTKAPTGKTMTELVERYLSLKGDSVREEAQRRLDSLADIEDMDF